MRSRIVLGCVLLTALIVLGAGLVQSYTVSGELRVRQSANLRHLATQLAQQIDDRQRRGRPIDATYLDGLLSSEERLSLTDANDVVLSAGSDDLGDRPISVNVPVADSGRLTVSQEYIGSGMLMDFRTRAVLVALLILIAAAFLGWLLATWISRPFRRLADASLALVRGRFELVLPVTRIPEARVIATGLERSAAQLQDRLHRERDLAMHTSHLVRTPLTGLRLRLDGIAATPGVDAEITSEIGDSLTAVDAIVATVEEMVELNRGGALMGGAQVTVAELATTITQWWVNQLHPSGRSVTASVSGDLGLRVTPGPIEHALDLLLLDLKTSGSGDVRLEFVGAETTLKIAIAGAGRSTVPVETNTHAVELIEALGGHSRMAPETFSYELVLPRR